MKASLLALALLLTGTSAFAGVDLAGEYTCDFESSGSPEITIETANSFTISRSGKMISFSDLTNGEMQTTECKTGKIEIANEAAVAKGTIACSTSELVLSLGMSANGVQATTKFAMTKKNATELAVSTDVKMIQNGQTYFAKVRGVCYQD